VKLIQDFSTKVKAIPGEIDGSAFLSAKNLLSNVRRGDINFETAKVDMEAMLTKHNQRSDPTEEVTQAFEKWVDAMRFTPSREVMLGKLESWQKGEVTDFQMLVFIEDKIAKGEVPGQWLEDGGSNKPLVEVGTDKELLQDVLLTEEFGGSSDTPWVEVGTDMGLIKNAEANGFKLTDVLKEAIKKAADSDDQNIVA
jgi:hypothetical protein